MSYRTIQIYVASRTARLLRHVTKLYPMRNETTVDAIATIDQTADAILNSTIEEKYPLALGLLREQDKLEKDYILKAQKNG